MNMKIVLRSWKFWVLCAVSAVITVFLALGTVWGIYANIKIETPTNLNVIALSNGEIYAEVDESAKASGFEFVIWTNLNNVEKYTSSTNIINITNIIQTPNNYQIKCRVLGKTVNAHSNYCATIQYSSAVKIDTPTIAFVAGNTPRLAFSLNDNFSQSITLGFELYYKANSSSEFLKYTTFFITGETHYGDAQGYFQLTFLTAIGAGEYSLGVKALSPNNDFYLESDLSSQLVYIVE